ncbi:Mitochondrial distribution and morphology protein 12 [Linnemannia gamsii]|uniref:Mitochondrial distribution and morphology protein 12 n=1 Tax=Linnemannia gamsii TaxID=64522 RepID=A0ABQ7K5P8_9FUNG|nr:Mitochondrial distribution and morphology protein 12 [Linnemannia gamsii]
MSFVFEWDKLDDEVALQIEGMIHAHFQRIPKPTFMGNIAVSKFRFGSTPPNITVLDVTDPLEEWYVHMDQEEARLAQEAAEGGGGESMDEDELASGEEYDDEYSYSGDGSIVMVGEGDDIEYLRSGSYEEDGRLETEDWMLRNRSHRQDGSGSDHEYYTSTRDQNLHFKSALASPTRISPSSSASSSGSGQSRRPSAYDPLPQGVNRYFGDSKESKAASKATNRSNRNPKLGIDTNLASPSRTRSSSSAQYNPASTKRLAKTHSLSSHASDDEIESEAFYTQGESTIYQRMKNLVLEPSSFLSSRPASVEGESSDDQPQPKPSSTAHQTTLGAPLFPTTPGGPNGNANNGLGFGFNAGIGSSSGSVLSSVMQTRSNTRPLSAASFYSTPPAAGTAAGGAATSHATTAQHPQLYFPDLSGMVVSGNSLLGLRAGTPSRTIPSTPRGFESPTLAFSRRQSFSDNGSDDPVANSASNRHSAPLPIPSQSGPDQHHQPSEYMSPVEALSFDAFSRQPKVVERLKDEEDIHPPRSRSAQSYNGDHRSQHQASPRSRPDRVSKRHENDIQMLLAVHYQGQMGFTVETELLLNYPTYAFLTLPVKLVITGFSFKTKMLMGYLRDHVNVSFLEPEDPNESILSNVRIESQVGDEQKQAVLKNVGKIERFVVEQLRKFITEDFVYPSYHSVELVRAPAPAPPVTQPADATGSAPTLTAGGSTGCDQSSSRGFSPAPSTTAESINNEPNDSILDDARDGPFNVTIQAGIAGAILILAGFILCFFGYRVFHVTMFLIGFYFFGNLTYIGMVNGGITNSTLLLAVAVGVGIVGGLLLVCCSKLGVAVLGALALYALGLWILGWKSGGVITTSTGRIILLAALAVVGFILGLFREREVVIVGSAILGAYSFVIGVDMFVHTGFKEQADQFINSKNTIEEHFENQSTGTYALLATFIVLAVLGFLVQFWAFGRRNFRPTAVAPAPAPVAPSNVVYTEKPSRFGFFRRRY